MNIRLFNRKRRERPIGLEDMIWAIKMLMMSKKEVKRMIMNLRDTILKFQE